MGAWAIIALVALPILPHFLNDIYIVALNETYLSRTPVNGNWTLRPGLAGKWLMWTLDFTVYLTLPVAALWFFLRKGWFSWEAFDFRTENLGRNAMLGLLLFALSAPEAQIYDDEDVQDLIQQGEKTGTESPDESAAPGSFLLLLKMLAALCLVLGLILLVAFLARRYMPGASRGAGGRSDAIHVIATKMLGGRRSLMLIRVRGQTLLLGLTPPSIQSLTEIHDIEGECAQPPDESEPASTDFAWRLDDTMRRSVPDSEVETSSLSS